MKILIVYDSFFGNTQKVAEEISKFLSKKHTVIFKKVPDFKKADLKDLGLLIVGSPTRAFSPSEGISKFLNEFSLENFDFIVFDTRIALEDIPKGLRFFIRLAGYADKKMVKVLKRKGGNEIVESEGFCVKDKEGPLKKGELGKVKVWLKEL